MASTISMSGKALTTFAAKLRIAAPEVREELGIELRGVAEAVAADARNNASWSRRLPGTIGVEKLDIGASVYAGGPGFPAAGAFENKGKQGTFRHPVFGNRNVWVAQKARPFLNPAVKKAIVAVQKAAVSAAMAAIAAVSGD